MTAMASTSAVELAKQMPGFRLRSTLQILKKLFD